MGPSTRERLKLRLATTVNFCFSDSKDRRLDRSANLEVAGWLDWWHGWEGYEGDSHSAKVYDGLWEVAV